MVREELSADIDPKHALNSGKPWGVFITFSLHSKQSIPK